MAFCAIRPVNVRRIRGVTAITIPEIAIAPPIICIELKVYFIKSWMSSVIVESKFKLGI